MLIRILFVIFVFFIVFVVLYFGLLMGFVGSFIGICFFFTFLCVVYMKLRWKFLRWYYIIGEIIFIVFGIIVGGFGFVYLGKVFVDFFRIF